MDDTSLSSAAPDSPPGQALAATDPTEQGALPPDGYDPADYRWVPVRRRPRYDGWTEEKQRRFIEVLADTGLVSAAAKAVGMSREGAHRLRRSAHGAAFARAWDAARDHAGGVIEDIAFERALEGVEQHVFDENGEVVATKRVYNDRLLMFLLRHLKPERYAATLAVAAARAQPPEAEVEACLRALEPPLPAPPEQLLAPDDLVHALDVADEADGTLPHWETEQRPAKSEARLAAEARAAEEARGEAAYAKMGTKEKMSSEEFKDLCHYLDPTLRSQRGKRRYR